MTGIELELFRHLLVSIAEEMGVVLRKTSYSANIKERRDYSCAVYDARGETVATTAFCTTGMTASIMISKIGRNDATAASSNATCKATVKRITPVMNGDT